MMTKSQPLNSAKHKLARRYAKAGLLVLPLYEMRNGVCSCRNPDCFSPGKHPRLKHGVKQASSDLASVDQWWSQWPDANIGIATGHIVSVFDVDLDKDGDKSLRWLEVTHGRLPKTWTTITGGGGRHYFFKMPDEELKNAVKLWKRTRARTLGCMVLHHGRSSLLSYPATFCNRCGMGCGSVKSDVRIHRR